MACKRGPLQSGPSRWFFRLALLLGWILGGTWWLRAQSPHPVLDAYIAGASWPLLAGFFALLVGTGLTVLAAEFDFGALNNFIAMGIAITKALLVLYFFMELRQSTRMTALTALLQRRISWAATRPPPIFGKSTCAMTPFSDSLSITRICA